MGVESSPEGDTSRVGCSARLRVDVRVRRWTERGNRDHDGAEPGSAAAHDHQAAVTATAATAATAASTSGRDLRAATTTAACGFHATTRQATPPTRRPSTRATEKEEGGRTGGDHVRTAAAARNHAGAADVPRPDGRGGGEPEFGIVLEPPAASPRHRARAVAGRGRDRADPTRTFAKACRDRGLRAT
jgi:hypothetical protein